MVESKTWGGTLPEAVARDLDGKLRGGVVLPGSPDYEQARLVWNGMIDKRPAAIVRCATEADVIAAVNVARQTSLLLAVRGGGHNVAGLGTCDDGLVIDLSGLKDISVDPVNRTARAGGGVLWGELDAATQAHGLATPGGVYSETGIAGLTLGGGFGWLRRKYGLSSDNLIGADVVTADGKLVHTSETENADLLWGLRGGGGNFGIVTTFEYRLHPVGPEVMTMMLFHDGADMVGMLKAFREFAAEAPDEISLICATGQAPPHSEAFPEEHWGKPFVLFVGCYAGPVEEGKRVLAPLFALGEPLADHSRVMPYVQAQKLFDEDYPAHIMRYYWKSTNLTGLSDEAIDVIADFSKRQPSPFTTTDIWHQGGAIARVPDDATAFSGRGAPFSLNVEANWEDPADDEANITWAREYLAAMARFADGTSYLNFPGFYEEGEEMIRRTFRGKYARLAELKRRYDPNNLFSLNHNVKP